MQLTTILRKRQASFKLNFESISDILFTVTAEIPTEIKEFPKWMTRDEYLQSLPEVDRANLEAITTFLKDNLKDEFEAGDAKLFVVGSSAVPKVVLEREPNDIDLRVLLKERPVDFHDLFILMHNLYDSYKQSGLVENFGDPRFNWHYDENLSTDSPFIRLQPKEGIPIDIFLPFIKYDMDLQWFLDDHQRNLDNLGRDLSKRYNDGREEMLKKRAYIVSLI